MDECIPPIIRDSKWFMYPFFWYWFKGKNIPFYMDFKKIVNNLTTEEFENSYRQLDCKAGDRPTDLNTLCIEHMLKKIPAGNLSFLDVGCGRGYWLNRLRQEGKTNLTGCDVFENMQLPWANYIKCNIESLPFEDKSFDIVSCHHTLEHVRDIEKAVSELKRITRKQLIIVVPRQRYNYYTLDLHLHFFWIEQELTRLINLKRYECRNLTGDWCYIGYIDN